MAANDGGLRLVEASPSPFKTARQLESQETPDSTNESPRRSEKEKQSAEEQPSLVDIHKEAIKDLLLQTEKGRLDSKQQKLQQLKRKRISLAAELAEKRQSFSTVGDELRKRKRNVDLLESRPYLQTWKENSNSLLRNQSKNHLFLQSDSSVVEPLVDQVLTNRDVALRMHAIRQRQKIAAAYRLAGISVMPCADTEVLALRFDISVEGHFVACYHALFDLVMVEEPDDTTHAKENDVYLRLVQHTLPSSVPLASILEETLGGVAHVGPADNELHWKTDGLVGRLRQCSNQLYHACYCYSVRKHAFQLLQSMTKDAAKAENRSYYVDQLEPNDACDKISFHLKLLSGISSLEIDLVYKDPMRPSPTSVHVKNAAALGNTNPRLPAAYAAEISDDEEQNDDLSETAMIAFKRQPISKAVKDVTEAMAEW